jgi:hypothetical protein
MGANGQSPRSCQRKDCGGAVLCFDGETCCLLCGRPPLRNGSASEIDWEFDELDALLHAPPGPLRIRLRPSTELPLPVFAPVRLTPRPVGRRKPSPLLTEDEEAVLLGGRTARMSRKVRNTGEA